MKKVPPRKENQNKELKKIYLNDDSQCHWYGMADYEIQLALLGKVLKIMYVSEPPFGDSYHKLHIGDTEFGGFVWGCHFLFPFNQQYLICFWMAELYERKTIIINLLNLDYYLLPVYYNTFTRQDNSIAFKDSNSNKTRTVHLEEIRKLCS